MRFIKLKDGDLEVLEYQIAHSRNATFRKRCQAILMSSKGIEAITIAKSFSTLAATIYIWFNLYERSGIASLRNKPGQGRKPKLSAENLAQVVEAVEQDRQQLKTALTQLQQADIHICKRTLKNFLKKMVSAIEGSEGV